MGREWTESQKKAIDARGMQVLVSAAAGSGKTSVLTERVKRILSDTENKCYVSEILVVTFTRAAANEMRERIYKALSKAAAEGLENPEYLRSQMTLLPTADICTIDSFCAKIVRENFHLADVGADFNILDDKDNAELMKNAIEQVINELYEEDNGAFKELSKMFLNERDDSVLEDVITSLYNYSRSYPSPSLWLDTVADSFLPDKTPDDTSWAEVIYKYIILFSDFHYSRLKKCVTLMEESGGFNNDYFTRFERSAENLSNLKNAAQNRNWDGMISIINEGLIVKPSARNSKVNEDVKVLTQDVFKEFEDDVKSLEKRTLPSVSDHKADCERLYPVVRVLCDSVKRLTAVLDEAKKEKNSYSFDDILHKCIDLLVVFDESGWTKTPLAQELSANYKEILIDEYQDTNEAQNIIFDVLSRDKSNLYVVGDVKQSIYRFRLASPDLFMNLKETLGDFDGTLKPSQITLENNFRSREGVTNAVNFIFQRIMSSDVGEIDYNEKEFLYYSAKFPEKDTPDTRIVCIDSRASEDDDSIPGEPEEVAKYIKSTVQSKVTVGGSDGLRNVTWGDFCILLRSTKNKAQKYADALRKEGIPVTTGLDGDAQEYKEIRFLTSLVSIINNPLMDIPLIAVLMSPVFGFTADEVAQIRMTERKTDLFVALTKASENSPKIKAFIDKLQLYRNIAAAYPINDFVRFIVDDTAVADIYYSVGEGEQRKANVNGFIKLADDFVEGGRNGLTEFVRYMENAAQNGGIKSVSNATADDNSVKIMSIHKSKGLEFPYVLIADCSKRFNRSDSYGALTVARETGLGLKVRDDDLFTRYHTVSSAATEKAVLFGDMSEELRVLYVAMTRAKEHLVFFCDVSSESLCKKVRLNNALSLDKSGKLHPYAVYRASSMSEWLLSCFASHRDCGVIRSICNISQEKFEEKTDFGIDTAYITSAVHAQQVEDVKTECASVNEELLQTVTENISYSYPYDFSGIIAKRTASSMETNASKSEYFATQKPAFLSDKFTGAQRGTAIHKFLEFCDFHQAYADIEAEKSRLISSSLMSQKELEVLDENAVVSFLNSSVGKRLLSSNQVYKEYEFSILKNAGELYTDVPELARNEQIVVQGKLDCAFVENGEIILIDYKTDNITDESVFVETYSGQLKIYAQAMEECTGLHVSEIYIYSFKLKKFICVKESIYG